MADPDKLYQNSLNILAAIQEPDINQMKIKLQQLVQQGVLTPEQAQAATVNHNAYSDITTNPQSTQAQMTALGQLQNIGEEGGLTPLDQAKIADIQQELNTTERGRQEALQQNFKERGILNSGLELSARQNSEQAAADRASREGLDVAAQAQQRALSAIQGAGQLGGQIRGQEFGEKGQVAGAQNAIDLANSQMLNQFNLYNTQAANAAQAQNLAEKQRVSDTNTSIANQQEVSNKALPEQQYENALQKAQEMVGVNQNWAAKAAKKQAASQAYDRALTAAGIQAAAAGVSHGASAFAPTPTAAPSGYNPNIQENQLPGGYAHGGIIPGVPKVKGDSPKNDTKLAKVSPGEAIIPRSEVQKHHDVVGAFLAGRSPVNPMKPPKAPRTTGVPNIGHEEVAKVLHALASLKGK